jgi:uncharacterized protein
MLRMLVLFLLLALPALPACDAARDDVPPQATYPLSGVPPERQPDGAGPLPEDAEASAAPAPTDDGGPPPMERAVEAKSPDRLRVLVLSGGGYHDFAANLKLLLAALERRRPMTLTELVLAPGEVASPTSRRALEAADLPAEHDVLLVYTQGDLALTPGMQAKLLAFVHGGGGLVALHCAADSFPGWAGWDDLLRGRFERHPPYGNIVVGVRDAAHPVLAGLPPEWILRDEFYHLKDCAPDDKHVIMDGTSPEGGAPRPVTWVREAGAGRVVCTILGHDAATHGDARYQQLVEQALAWAARRSQ